MPDKKIHVIVNDIETWAVTKGQLISKANFKNEPKN